MKNIKKTNSLPNFEYAFSQNPQRRRHHQSEFQEMLEAYMVETAEDLEAYQLQFPRHGHFWDDGYRDIRLVGNGE